jgi:hypothetical protein
MIVAILSGSQTIWELHNGTAVFALRDFDLIKVFVFGIH